MASKREILNALNTLNFEDMVVDDVTITADEIKDFIETSIVQLDKKAEAAAKRSAEKRQAGDELRARIKGVIVDDFKTIPEILEALNDDTITSAMVVARLGQLYKIGEVEKSDVKVDARTIKSYKAINNVAEF